MSVRSADAAQHLSVVGLLTFQFLWKREGNARLQGKLFGIAFSFVDVVDVGPLMVPNCVSEDNMLTFAVCSQSSASL